jgi:mono/diheme cytochrome c family protein
MIRPVRTLARPAAIFFTFALASVLALTACGGGGEPDATDTDDAAAGGASAAGAAELTAVEMAQGIGPVRDMVLEELDPDLAAEGETAFATKCSACHKLEERYVGPELGTVLSRRRPEFIMNMILNSNEMVQRHPEVQALLAQYYTPMPTQVTDPDEARAILEYLRSAQTDPDAASPATSGGA